MVYRGNPIKLDDVGVPLFQETSIYENYLPEKGEAFWVNFENFP